MTHLPSDCERQGRGPVCADSSAMTLEAPDRSPSRAARHRNGLRGLSRRGLQAGGEDRKDEECRDCPTPGEPWSNLHESMVRRSPARVQVCSSERPGVRAIRTSTGQDATTSEAASIRHGDANPSPPMLCPPRHAARVITPRVGDGGSVDRRVDLGVVAALPVMPEAMSPRPQCLPRPATPGGPRLTCPIAETVQLVRIRHDNRQNIPLSLADDSGST